MDTALYDLHGLVGRSLRTVLMDRKED
jgi:hypothetical protein